MLSENIPQVFWKIRTIVIENGGKNEKNNDFINDDLNFLPFNNDSEEYNGCITRVYSPTDRHDFASIEGFSNEYIVYERKILTIKEAQKIIKWVAGYENNVIANV